MIVFGEKDSIVPVENLREMPKSETFMMKKAGHACYMDDPDEWNHRLYNFLRSSLVFGN